MGAARYVFPIDLLLFQISRSCFSGMVEGLPEPPNLKSIATSQWMKWVKF